MRIALGLACVVSLLATSVAAQLNETSATSTSRIEMLPTGDVAMHIRNARFEPLLQFAPDGKRRAWLVTVTADVISRSDAEGFDPASTVSFNVDDVTNGQAARLSSYADPGAEGRIVGNRYSVSVMPGCCAGPSLHRVRLLESGRALFMATGAGSAGSSAWAQVTTRPTRMRWAAFNGDVSAEQIRQGLLGTLVYGNDDGALSAVTLHGKASDDLYMWLTQTAQLAWIDRREAAGGVTSTSGPASGTPDVPKLIARADNVAALDPAAVADFSIALVIENRTLVTIPIVQDRLDAARASGTDVAVAPATLP
jgi:hypothetical protein